MKHFLLFAALGLSSLAISQTLYEEGFEVLVLEITSQTALFGLLGRTVKKVRLVMRRFLMSKLILERTPFIFTRRLLQEDQWMWSCSLD